MAAKPNAILKGALVEEKDCLAQIYAAAQIMKAPVRMCVKTQIMKMMKIWMYSLSIKKETSKPQFMKRKLTDICMCNSTPNTQSQPRTQSLMDWAYGRNGSVQQKRHTWKISRESSSYGEPRVLEKECGKDTREGRQPG